MITKTILSGAALVLLTACGTPKHSALPTDSIKRVPTVATSAANPNIPKCADLVGKVTNDWFAKLQQAGCYQNDSLQMAGYMTCKDGNTAITFGSGPFFVGLSGGHGVIKQQPTPLATC